MFFSIDICIKKQKKYYAIDDIFLENSRSQNNTICKNTFFKFFIYFCIEICYNVYVVIFEPL